MKRQGEDGWRSAERAPEPAERGSCLTLQSSMVRRINRAVARECEKLTGAGHTPVLLVSPEIRLHVRRMTAAQMPNLVVLRYGEIVQDVKVESLGMVVIE